MKRVKLTTNSSGSWKNSLIYRGRKDPVWWISEVLGDKLWSKQEDICWSVLNNERTACPACFSDDTEILTEGRGFQLFKNLMPTDKVASYVNGRLEYVTPQNYYEYDYNGELIGCKTNQVDFLVTPNHRLLFKHGEQFFPERDWTIAAAELVAESPRVYFNKEVIWNGVEDTWTEQHYELWGFWCADGSIETGDRAIWITQKNHIEKARSLLSVYGLPIVEYAKGNGGVILALRDKELTSWFLEQFGRHKSVRTLPLWLKMAPSYKLKAFLRGFFLADGSYIERFGEKYAPNVIAGVYYPHLAEEIYEVALKAGFGVSIRKVVKQYSEKQYGGKRTVTSWNIGLLRNNQFVCAGKKAWYTQKYTGKVYCVQVPSGLIYVRRNGLVHISHNSYGVGKCMAYGQPMYLPNGLVVPVESLVGCTFSVWAWDTHTNAIVPAPAFAEDNGNRLIYEVITESGYRIQRTGNHPLWSKADLATEARWVPVELLRKGDFVATVVKDRIPDHHLPVGYSWEAIRFINFVGYRKTVGICVPEYGTYLTTFVEHNTFLAARIALWFLYNFKPAKVITTGPTLRQVRDLLWKELRTAHQKARIPLGGTLLQMSLTLNDEHYAVGFSTDDQSTDKFTGYHSPNQLVIFDQAAGIPTPIWESAEGLMTSENCRWLAISNTAISDSELANICIPDRRTRFGKWNVIKITAAESPNVVAGRNIYPGLVSYDWVKRREESWGKDDPLYKIFIEAEFVQSAQMSVIPYRYILPAFENAGEISDTIEIGVDVARMGMDSTVFFARSGTKALEVRRLTGNNTMEVVGELVRFKQDLESGYHMPVTIIKIDIIGIGAGVYDRCLELDDPLPAMPINNAEKPVVETERYLNLRAELAWTFRRRMELGEIGLRGVVVNDFDILEYLQQDINAMKYKISSNGKIQLWSKDDLKIVLGRSPDYWDACVMAYETPGGIPSLEVVNGLPKPERSNVVMSDEEWNAFLGMAVSIDDPSFKVLAM